MSRIAAAGGLQQQEDPSPNAVLGKGGAEPALALSTTELKRILRSMSAQFRDSEGAGIVERFEEISKLLFCKFFDEIEPSAASPFRGGSNTTEREVYRQICAVYEKARRQYQTLAAFNPSGISRDVTAVTRCVELLSGITLKTIPADIKGVAYEELVKDTFDKTENQQYFTPRPIVEFMVQLVKPRESERVCDPACGTGGFLVEVAKRTAPRSTGSAHLIGIEIDRRMAWTAQLNLILHGLRHPCVYYFPRGGSLSFSNGSAGILRDDSFDVLLTNPPFGSDFSDSAQLAHYMVGRGKQGRRRGVLFLERCIRMVKPHGRIAIIIDDSVLNGPNNADVRRLISDQCRVEAVFSLPEVAFMPYATAKSSILYLIKNREPVGGRHMVFMADVQHVGRRPNGDPEFSDETDQRGRPKLLNELPSILEKWRQYKHEATAFKGSDKVFVVTPEKIEAARGHDFRLDLPFFHPARDEAEGLLARAAYPVVRLADLADEQSDTIVPSVDIADQIIRYIGLANILSETGEYTVSTVRGNEVKSTVRVFRPGEILFAKLRPELRKVVLIPPDEEDGYVSSECMVLRLRGQKDLSCVPQLHFYPLPPVDPEFLSYMLRSNLVFGQLVYQVTGVGRPRISKSAILNLRLPIPPLEEQAYLRELFRQAHRDYLRQREQSRLALREGEERLKEAYEVATKRVCPL